MGVDVQPNAVVKLEPIDKDKPIYEWPLKIKTRKREPNREDVIEVEHGKLRSTECAGTVSP